MILLQIIKLFLQDLQVSPPTVPIGIINCLTAMMDLISSPGNLNLAPWLPEFSSTERILFCKLPWLFGWSDREIRVELTKHPNRTINFESQLLGLLPIWSVWTFDLDKTKTPRLPLVNLYISQYRANMRMRYSITNLSH